MMNKNISSRKQETKMLEPQEKNPERLLPAGHRHAAIRLVYYLILNMVVFSAVYGILILFFQQKNQFSLVAAESTTAFTLMLSIILWFKFRHQG